MEFTHSRLQIINRCPGWLDDKISHLGNVQRPAAGACWAVDDEYIIVIGNCEGLGSGGKGFHGNSGLKACASQARKPQTSFTDGAVPSPTRRKNGSGPTAEFPAGGTVKDLAIAMGMAPGDVQKKLMDMGVLAAVNQRLSPDAARKLLGRTLRKLSGELGAF